jgi:hypothetical protein
MNKRIEVRSSVINYMDKFFSDFILYRDFPVKQKLARKHWVDTLYEELSQSQREEIYKELKKQK